MQVNADVSGTDLPMENMGTERRPVFRPRMQMPQIVNTLRKRWFLTNHPGLAEINAPVGPQEVVGHTLNSELLIG